MTLYFDTPPEEEPLLIEETSPVKVSPSIASRLIATCCPSLIERMSSSSTLIVTCISSLFCRVKAVVLLCSYRSLELLDELEDELDPLDEELLLELDDEELLLELDDEELLLLLDDEELLLELDDVLLLELLLSELLELLSELDDEEELFLPDEEDVLSSSESDESVASVKTMETVIVS